jgi:hypothetical protein
MITIIAFAVGLVLGLVFGFVFFRSELAYLEGFQHGEHYGRGEGYRQGWLERNKHFLDAETEDWNESCDD